MLYVLRFLYFQGCIVEQSSVPRAYVYVVLYYYMYIESFIDCCKCLAMLFEQAYSLGSLASQ